MCTNAILTYTNSTLDHAKHVAKPGHSTSKEKIKPPFSFEFKVNFIARAQSFLSINANIYGWKMNTDIPSSIIFFQTISVASVSNNFICTLHYLSHTNAQYVSLTKSMMLYKFVTELLSIFPTVIELCSQIQEVTARWLFQIRHYRFTINRILRSS